MPFDGRSKPNAVEILSRMEEAFRSGEWGWARWHKGPDGECLLTGMGKVCLQYSCSRYTWGLGDGGLSARVIDLLYEAIPGRKCANKRDAIARYNDAKGRTLEDILEVIAKAKTLARESA